MRPVCICVFVTTCLMVCVNVVWALDVNNKSEDITHLKNRNSSRSTGNVLLISFDSFGWKYFDLVGTPVLDTFKKFGVYADYMLNVIPTETFPNHVSLATGLYPESHGIISNSMYDPVFEDKFNMSVTDPKWWWHDDFEPIWYTNEKQGGISGITYWPGYNIKNYTPTHWCENNTISYKERVDLVLSWLKSDKPPNFLMLYFGMLDHIGHHYGFGSPQTLEEVKNLDEITGYLIKQLKKNNLFDKWNIILTADHGMTNVSRTRVINVTDYINRSECMVNGDNGLRFVWPHKGMKNAVYKKLKEKTHPHMHVYLKEDFPEKFHYRNNRRVSPILLIIDEGWSLVTHPETFNWAKPFGGAHGYLNDVPSMWPLFRARGPAFKEGYHSKVINLVDLYPLMCKLLKIKAKPNNGSFAAVEPLLGGNNDDSSSFSAILIGFMAILFFALAILTGYFRLKGFPTQKIARGQTMLQARLLL